MRNLASGLVAGCTVFVLALSCSSEDAKKKVAPSPSRGGAGGASAGQAGEPVRGGAAGENGGPSGGGMGGEAGTIAEAGAAGNGGDTAGAGGEGGMAGTAGAGATGAGGEAGEGGTGASAGAAGDGGTGGVDPTTCDAPGEPCCGGSSCSGSLSCAGTACACVDDIFNEYLVRPDGRLLRIAGATTQTPVYDQSTSSVMVDVASVISGQFHGCASKMDGSVWCWAETSGGNGSGQLGNGVIGGTVANYQATRVQTGPGPTYLEGVSSLQTSSLGGYILATNCAVTELGGVYCWGHDGDGELIPTGGAAAQDEPYATQILSAPAVPLTGAVQVAVGPRHACVVNDAREVWCWGSNVGGALGNGAETDSVYPVRSGSLTEVTKVITGSDGSCALVGAGTEAGRVFCWGSSGSGQVGIGTPSMNTDGCINFCKVLPTRVRVSESEYLEDVVDIEAGYLFNCAIKSDRSVWCWGSLDAGLSHYAAPLVVQETPVTGVAQLTIDSTSIRTLTSNGEYALIQANRTVATPNCGLLE